MAEVLSYATPTTDGLEVRRYDRWQRRMKLAQRLRWFWLGLMALGFVVVALMWMVGDDIQSNRSARAAILFFQMLFGGPGYVLIVTFGASGKIWTMPLAAICGIGALWVGIGMFSELLFGNFAGAGVTTLIWVTFSYCWYAIAIVVGRLETPVRMAKSPFDPNLLERVE